MWEIHIGNQAATFLWSILLGGFYCLFYDVFRAFRSAVRHQNIAVFFEDILFWVVAAFTSFIFLLSRTNGEPRGYVFAAIVLGFAVTRISVSKPFFAAARFITKSVAWILRPFGRKYRQITDKISAVCRAFEKKVVYLLKKSPFRAKKS